MARRACLGWLTALAMAGVAHAQITERAQSAAQGVKGLYGTEQGLQQNGFDPLSTERPMQTVNGQPFPAQMACKSTEQFLRVTMFPAASSDIGRFTVETDRDMNGSLESREDFQGPFAGVCNNGVIACTAGTFENCRYLRFHDAAGRLGLEEVTLHELGACYCVNASCGNNLLLVNSQKVISDIAAGIVETLKSVQPRLTVARAQVLDELTVAYYGQEAGCGADRSPETYFKHPNDLAQVGANEVARPGSLAHFVMGTALADQHGVSAMQCAVRREVTTSSVAKGDVIRLVSSTRGAAVDCGPGCLRFRIGDEVFGLYGGGNGGTRCRINTEAQQYLVGIPERLESVTLQSATFDDAIRLNVDGAAVYRSPASWSGAGIPGFRCDYGNHALALNTNLTSAFAHAGSVNLQLEIAHDKRGEGWMWLEARVREGCDVASETVIDGCTAAAANADCSLESETVDGVQTVRNGLTTGLAPLASSRSVGVACQIDSGLRPWWVTERTYRCRTAAPAYDFTAAEERYASVHGTFDPASGNFTDRRIENGRVSLSAQTTSLPEAAVSAGCIPMCRTRKPRPGASVGDLVAPTTTLNATGVAYDFKFKECETNGVCPIEAGEEEVAACDCRSNFAQAAAMMQTIRMVGEDMVCTAPP